MAAKANMDHEEGKWTMKRESGPSVRLFFGVHIPDLGSSFVCHDPEFRVA